MIDPYKMVMINVGLFLLLVGGLLSYRYIFPKKPFNYLSLVILFSLLPVIHIFRGGGYESGDFSAHVYRALEFFYLLKEGILLPSWAGNLNATYGYPLFIFLNPLPYYLQSLIHAVGFSFIMSLKILLASSYILSGVFFYFWAQKEIKNSFAAFCGAIVYLFTPYHLVDLHFRVALGEIVFFMLLPLFFYSITFLRDRYTSTRVILSSFVFASMMFSHQALTVFSLGIIIPYLLLTMFNSSNPRTTFLLLVSPIMFGSLFSLYIWFPHLYYPQYTLAYLLTTQTVVFPQLWELLYSPWRFGLLFQGPYGELSYLLGYTQIVVLVYGLVSMFTKWTQNLSMALWVLLSLGIIFMISPFSTLLWQTLPILNTAQFSTRFLLLFTYSIAALSVYLALCYKGFRPVIWIFIFLTVGYTILNWGHRRMLPEVTDTHFVQNLNLSTSEGEGFCCMGEPKWTLPTRGWMNTVPQAPIETRNGTAQMSQISRSSTRHVYAVSTKETQTVIENTWYFPGWRVLVDGKKVPISISKEPVAGLITFSVPKGLHLVEVIYKDLLVLQYAKGIAVTSMVSALLLLLFLQTKKILYILANIHNLSFFHTRKKRK